MNELIRIENQKIGGGFVQTVNARELHAFLDVKKDFSTWIKKQIERARLIEGRDFIVITGSPKKGNGEFNPKPSVEYHLTIEAAKHIAMMSGCDKGFEVRDYFLECERIATQATAVAIPTHAEALRLAADLVEKNEALARQIEAERPKTLFADALSTSESSILVRELAKLLKQNGIDIGQNRLFDWLREHGYLIKAQGSDRGLPTQRSMDLCLFEVKTRPIIDASGTVRISKTVKVTGKGQLYFINKFLNEKTEAAV